MMQEAGHLVALPGNEWGLWRWVGLRSAGFPVEGVLKLAPSPELIVAADAVAKATQTTELARQKVHQEINSALDELRSMGQWDDKKKRHALLNARTKINAGEIPQSLPELDSSVATAEFIAAIRQLEAARVDYHERFSKSWASNSKSIREIAESSGFREALTWQNRAALRTALDPILSHSRNGSLRSSAQKQHEELVASYWQRYCTKNDTIGFFGPVGWAQFTTNVEHLAARPGQQLIATRKVYWETWAIQALGKVIAQRAEIRQWIVPILMPMVRIENKVLHHPRFESVEISDKEAALLQACDGRVTAKEIATRFLLSPERFQNENEVYATLRELADKEYVFWNFNIPAEPYPEQVLQNALQRIEDAKLREWALDLLNELESAKTCVETSSGNVDRLNLAYQNLEQTFTRITGAPATRHSGKIYAGRTLIYLDCRREVEVLLGPELLRSLGEPLSLLLAAARWFTWRVAERYKETFLEIHSEFVRSRGETSVDAAAYFEKAAPLLGPQTLVPSLQKEFRDKWARILQLGSNLETVTYTCDELRDRIEQEFPATPPGWLCARYHSPDVMIAAASEQAIRRGDYFFVMGEIHASMNTLAASLFVNQHPSPKEMLDAVEHDLGGLNVMPLMPSGLLGSRTAHSLIPKSTYLLEYADSSFEVDRAKVLSMSSLVLENHDGEVIARTRDDTFRMNIVDLVGWPLSVLAADCFRGAIAPGRHTPRISIDRLVIKRESWRFSPSELLFAQCRDSADRFLQTRMWAQEQGIPRFAFFKVPGERQPAYVDFESPILVDIFNRLIRRALEAKSPDTNVEISEMLPTSDQLWLTDAESQRYTCELRFVAVDQGELMSRENEGNTSSRLATDSEVLAS